MKDLVDIKRKFVLNIYLCIHGFDGFIYGHQQLQGINAALPSFGTKEWSRLQILDTSSLIATQLAWASVAKGGIRGIQVEVQ